MKREKKTHSARLARMIQSPASPRTDTASAKASALASRASMLISAMGGKFAMTGLGAAAGAGAGAGTGAGAGAGAADARSKKEVMMVTIIVMAEVKV